MSDFVSCIKLGYVESCFGLISWVFLTRCVVMCSIVFRSGVCVVLCCLVLRFWCVVLCFFLVLCGVVCCVALSCLVCCLLFFALSCVGFTFIL